MKDAVSTLMDQSGFAAAARSFFDSSQDDRANDQVMSPQVFAHIYSNTSNVYGLVRSRSLCFFFSLARTHTSIRQFTSQQVHMLRSPFLSPSLFPSLSLYLSLSDSTNYKDSQYLGDFDDVHVLTPPSFLIFPPSLPLLSFLLLLFLLLPPSPVVNTFITETTPRREGSVFNRHISPKQIF